MEVETDSNLRAEARKAFSPAQRGKRGRPLPLPLSSPLDVITLFVIMKCLINQPHPVSESHFLFRHAHIVLTLPKELTQL